MSSEREAVAEALINDGRRYYEAKRFKQALECFTRAMKRCPCTRNTRRERCSCKQYEKVASENGSIFDEAMYKCTCDVGKTFNKCDNMLHIKAIDYRAATFEAIQELDRARRDAEWILELAPRLPDGYLRLGKIARLQKKHEFAWKVYNAGIEVNQSNEAKALAKVKSLYAARKPLHKRFFRHDPCQLPLDIVQGIFELMDVRSLLQCLRVSKVWARFLISPVNRRLWRCLDFGKVQKPVSMTALCKVIKYSGNDVRKVIVPEAQKLQLNAAKFEALLRGAPNLQEFYLRGDNEAYKVSMKEKSRSLTHLTLMYCRIPEKIIESSWAESLQHLYINDRRQEGPWEFTETSLEVPLMPNLKTLRVESNELTVEYMMMTRLARSVPNLEQLLLQGVTLAADSVDKDMDEVANIWTKLKVLLIKLTNLRAQFGIIILSRLAAIGREIGLQYLEVGSRVEEYEDSHGVSFLAQTQTLEFPTPQSMSGPIEDSSGVVNSSYRGFTELRSLRLDQVVLDPLESKHMVKPSMEAGKLKTFDIVFPNPELNEQEGVKSCRRLSKFEWLRGVESITSIGLFNFHFKQYARDENERPLPDFLASFPNLKILEITSDRYEEGEFCVLIAEIIKRTRLDSIYQSSIKGSNLDKMKKLAATAGVQFEWGKRPVVFPLPIERE